MACMIAFSVTSCGPEKDNAFSRCVKDGNTTDDVDDGFIAKISKAHSYIESGTGAIYAYDPDAQGSIVDSFRVYDDFYIKDRIFHNKNNPFEIVVCEVSGDIPKD
jgi:hypothetical protein